MLLGAHLTLLPTAVVHGPWSDKAHANFHSLPLNDLKVNEITPILVQLNVSIPLSGYKDACLVPVSNGERVLSALLTTAG